jgi:dTMP kinase
VKGRLITIEGGEGSGKTTLIQRLQSELERQGVDAIFTREPGGTEQGEQIRQLLVKGPTVRWDAFSEALLLFASRRHLMVNIIKPALDAGKWVICDRFFDSTVVYQGYAGGVSIPLIRQIYSAIAEGVMPDITFILDIDPAIGLARASKRLINESNDEMRFENKSIEYHQKIRKGFLALAQEEPHRFRVMPSDLSSEEIFVRCLKVIEPWLKTP